MGGLDVVHACMLIDNGLGDTSYKSVSLMGRSNGALWKFDSSRSTNKRCWPG